MEGDSRNPKVSLLKKYDIPIDHLSFEYIQSCKDKKELEKIIRILRSGEEGIYPDLMKTAENQLRLIAPDSRVLRVETQALTKESFSNEEWQELENELLLWEEEMTVMDKGLEFEKKRYDIIGNKNLPEVRKTVEKKPEQKMDKKTKIKIETNSRNERIKSGDYEAWDKFDIDKELLKIDLDDERKMEKNAKMKREIEKQKKLVQEKIEPVTLDKDSYSNAEHPILANKAKDIGNEYFKSGDYANALKYYDLSINVCPTANAYNNRAMTYIKLKKYEEALNDCHAVLKMEPNNIKALHRRATAYQNLSLEKNNELALKDLTKIVSLEPTNRVAQSDLLLLKKKLNIQDIGKKCSMAIEETDNIADVRKLPLTYYGPSTSTFKCEPLSLTHRMLAGASFSGQVMCKCNGNATRQNPLCHTCGERLSRPRQKPKPASTNQSQGKSEVNALNEGIKNIQLNSDKAESNLGNKLKVPADDKPDENVKISQGDNKVQFKSIFDEENENSKQKVITNEMNEINKICELRQEKKSGVDGELNGKSEEESNKKDSVLDNSICDEKNREQVKNVINELKQTDQKLDVDNISNKETEGGEEAKEETDGNRKLFQELDMSMKERKNEDNEHFKGSGVVSEKEMPEGTTVNKSSNQNGLSESLPNVSGQKETTSETKKRSKKKKASKNQRQDGACTKFPEPVKIVQATKYLQPTRPEPKPEVESSKESQKEISKDGVCEFKSFVPNRKCGSTESGVLKSSTTAPYSGNLKDREYGLSSPLYTTGNLDKMSKHCWVNKENIIDGNSFENHKNNHVEGGDGSAVAQSSFEFLKSWQAMKNTDESYEKRAEMMRDMKPENLKTIIGYNLDSDMLTSLLECLEKHFVENDPNKVTGVLKELPQIPRFSLVNLFLSPSERKVIERLIETTEKKGFVLDEEVKSSLKLSF